MSGLCRNSRPVVTRRDVLTRSALGIGGLGLASLLQDAGYAADVAIDPSAPLAARSPHFTPRARRVIQIFCEGGPSQVDLFDPKPALQKYDGQSADEAVKDYQKNAGETAAGMGRLSGKLTGSPFAFSRHGECGMEISELFPRLAEHADKLCVVRSMQTSSSVHELVQVRMNTSDFVSARPSVGAWAVYGLGTENANLPAFLAERGMLDDTLVILGGSLAAPPRPTPAATSRRSRAGTTAATTTPTTTAATAARTASTPSPGPTATT
jgi:hypothetical protein